MGGIYGRVEAPQLTFAITEVWYGVNGVNLTTWPLGFGLCGRRPGTRTSFRHGDLGWLWERSCGTDAAQAGVFAIIN